MNQLDRDIFEQSSLPSSLEDCRVMPL